MKTRELILILAIFYDFSLHLVELLDKVHIHPLYPNFPLFGLISYNWFWTIYWLIGLIIAISLIGEKTSVKSKTEVNISMPEIKKAIEEKEKE